MIKEYRVQCTGQYNWQVQEERYPGVWLRAKAFQGAHAWPEKALALIARQEPGVLAKINCAAGQRDGKACHACGIFHTPETHA